MTRRAGLDREGVVREAAALADAEGLEALTLARLASALGVRTPSLYNHIDGLMGLRRAIALTGTRDLAKILAHAAVGRAGDDAILAICHAYRAFANEHPGVYATLVRAPDPDDSDLQQASLEVVTIIVAALADYGFAEDEAIHTVRGLRSVLHGFTTLERAGGFGLPLDLDESFARLIGIFVTGLRRTGDRSD